MSAGWTSAGRTRDAFRAGGEIWFYDVFAVRAGMLGTELQEVSSEAIPQLRGPVIASNLTLQDDAYNATHAIVVDKNASTGPLIRCYDKDGNADNCTVDAIIQGY